MLVRVVIIDPGQDARRGLTAVTIGERYDIEIIACLVPPDDQETLDPQRLLSSRRLEPTAGGQLDLGDFKGPGPDHLSDSSLDVAESAKDDLPRPHPVGNPVTIGLQGFQHHIESVPQVRDHVIVVVGIPVAGVEGGCGSPHEDGVRNQLLGPRRRLQDREQLRARVREGVCATVAVTHVTIISHPITD
jgi:hypothetical protein